MSAESSQNIFHERSSEICDRITNAQTEAILEIADEIAATQDTMSNISGEVADKIITGYSLDDLTDFLDSIKPGSKLRINALMNQAVSHYYIELEGDNINE